MATLLVWTTDLERKADLDQAIHEWARLDRQLPGLRGLIEAKKRMRKRLIAEAKVEGKANGGRCVSFR